MIFGHTHRAGPLGDEPGWTLADGSAPGQHRQLGLLVGADRRRRAAPSPYWPGSCAVVGEAGPPELRGLLDELRPLAARA